MSNLRFKARASWRDLSNYLGDADIKQLCYATTVERSDDAFVIRQHGNKIAVIDVYALQLSNAGCGSPSTRIRLNTVVHDNDLPIRFTQRQYVQYVTYNGKEHEFHGTLYVRMRAGAWHAFQPNELASEDEQ